MPNGSQNTDADELEIDIAEDESVVDTQNTDEGEGESDAVIDPEEGDEEVVKLTPAEENAKRQEDAWVNKITSSKASVEDAPSWLHSRLNAKLDATAKVPNTEEVVRRTLEKEREQAEFQILKAEIPQLTPAQAKELKQRYKTLRPAGKVAALKAALDAMGLSKAVRDAEARGIAKGKVSFPRSGQPSVSRSEKSVGGVPIKVVRSDADWNKMVRDQQRD